VYYPSVLGERSTEEWIERYATSHQHPVNRTCHTVGIPLILVSIGFFGLGFFFHRFWHYAWALFLIGWIFQFVGHVFEGKPPEFFRDWRFLLVGVRWWWAKIQGRERVLQAEPLSTLLEGGALPTPASKQNDRSLHAFAGDSDDPPELRLP
jgi:hypothetical protein